MNKQHIIIVEDEEKIAKLLSDYLANEGFTCEHLPEGTDATERIIATAPSLVILDLMLPGKDGLTICKELRQTSNVPIIMLTAKVEEIDRLVGLELGADDYICKPFSPREVIARIKSILRRTGKYAQQVSGGINYRGLVVDPDKFTCHVNGTAVELTAVEFRMLTALLKTPGKVLSRDSLMNHAYDDYRVVSGRTIDSHIKNVRKKLADYLDGDDIIHSIYGVGYKIE